MSRNETDEWILDLFGMIVTVYTILLFAISHTMFEEYEISIQMQTHVLLTSNIKAILAYDPESLETVFMHTEALKV